MLGLSSLPYSHLLFFASLHPNLSPSTAHGFSTDDLSVRLFSSSKKNFSPSFRKSKEASPPLSFPSGDGFFPISSDLPSAVGCPGYLSTTQCSWRSRFFLTTCTFFFSVSCYSSFFRVTLTTFPLNIRIETALLAEMVGGRLLSLPPP